ncbi:NAD(P)-binding domain-containing protein [Lusitaniella coriacea LEGE 07157]|uniref:NAD(P)-binding domain-containing protein n=1 Tax=Lusitaniella coriacea LEGE 07157 TaxID=945747 RepID=A0A8J7DWR3_9CYAN|nr:NAD(P)-binding domain-containing protein [Lusitaniella coriacea]MBE9116581.1 NAD(P)-binding domain-containing protein [Lusitaniella coriacea LEGE 07157]
MKIGFIGYGSMAEALASKWVEKHSLFIGGRNREKAEKLAKKLGKAVEFGSEKEAASFGDVVVLATPHEAVFDAIEAAGGSDAFAGKVLLDINNPVELSDFLAKSYDGVSLAEAIAKAVPNAHVVKAFNMCQAKVWQMNPPKFDDRLLVVMYCGDDEKAKQKIAVLIEDVGCEAKDIGDLKYSRMLEPAAAIVIKLLFSGHGTYTVLNLIQPEV